MYRYEFTALCILFRIGDTFYETNDADYQTSIVFIKKEKRLAKISACQFTNRLSQENLSYRNVLVHREQMSTFYGGIYYQIREFQPTGTQTLCVVTAFREHMLAESITDAAAPMLI